MSRLLPSDRSGTNPEAVLTHKWEGKETKLVLMARALIDTQGGIRTDLQVTQGASTAE